MPDGAGFNPRDIAQQALKDWSSLLFLQCAWCGGVFLLAVAVVQPAVALYGTCGVVLARWLACRGSFSTALDSYVYAVNGLLSCMYIGVLVGFNTQAWALLVLAISLTIVVGSVLNAVVGSHRLPVLGLPFAIVGAFTSVIAGRLQPDLNLLPVTHGSAIFLPWIDGFLVSLSAVFFTPNALVGLAIVSVLMVTSRYLLILAFLGFLVAVAVFPLMGVSLSGAYHWLGFTSVLTAIALGGVFLQRSLTSLLTAMAGALLVALLTASLVGNLVASGLPGLSLPFILVALLLLFALQNRHHALPPYPVSSQEGAAAPMRLTGKVEENLNSTPVCFPVLGEWVVYQGFYGSYSHQPPWQYAIDLYITEAGKSYCNAGAWLSDYYCYGKPVVSPVYGTVVIIVDKFSDNPPLSVDLENPWGNYIVIAMSNGLYLLLAHLQQGSIQTWVGAEVIPGVQLAACGSSGRSPEPHLHMQVQEKTWPTSSTRPFHVLSTLTQADEGQLVYHHSLEPTQDMHLRKAVPGKLMTISVGQQFAYQVKMTNEEEQVRQLYVKLSPQNQFVISSDRGASALLNDTEMALVVSHRYGPRDDFFDAWLLAHSLTPHMEIALRWQDTPPLAWLTGSLLQKTVCSLLRPFGARLNSRFERHVVYGSAGWTQTGRHYIKLLPGYSLQAETKSHFDQAGRCIELTFSMRGTHCLAQIQEFVPAINSASA